MTGQDGSYLAELLLEKGYEVCGGVRRSSTYPINMDRIKHIKNDIVIKHLDLLDTPSILSAIKEFKPHEIYNMAAQSMVHRSWSEPLITMDINCKGVVRMLETIRIVDPTIKFLQASSSEMFGKAKTIPQDENTPFHPRSPYACSKVAAHLTVQNYRESYNMFACSAISFNHECISSKNVITIRKNGFIKICYVEDLKKPRPKSIQIYNFLVLMI